MKKIQVIFGTRPEAIKLYPVIMALKALPAVDVRVQVTVTGQHRQMLDQFLELTGLTPDVDLDIMRPDQSLNLTTSKLFERLPKPVMEFNPDWIVVQGDTVSAFCGAMIGFHHQVKVAHVEAGLRSYNLQAPWPEEGYRQMISRLAAIHFAPTERARTHLLSEGVAAEKIHVTGNTVVEAFQHFTQRIEHDSGLKQQLAEKFSFLDSSKKMILVTTHRRENQGQGIDDICKALAALGAREDVQVVLPIHQNPRVREPVKNALKHSKNVVLLDPQEYVPFLYLMNRAYLLLTDSGGIQEEAPSLGKPVLVMRETTERPEGIEAGVAKLVGTDPERILNAIMPLLNDPAAYAQMARASNPYGDGKATERIIAALCAEEAITPLLRVPA